MLEVTATWSVGVTTPPAPTKVTVSGAVAANPLPLMVTVAPGGPLAGLAATAGGPCT